MPLLSDVVLTVRAEPITSGYCAVAVCTGCELSVTATETLKLPVAVGVPMMDPLLKLMERPAGSPVADQVYGPRPPVARTVAEYVLFAVPFGRLVVVILSGDAAMTIVSGLLVYAVSLGVELSLTVRLTVLNVPALVGVPVIVAPLT